MKAPETIFIICTIISWTIFFILIQTAKNLLSKLGYSVTFMNISISDYQRLKKHKSDNKRILVVYKSLVISTYAVIVCTIIFLVSIIL